MQERILVWIDSNLTYFGISSSLLEKYDCELYAIYDIVDKPKEYFEKQKNVEFEKSWFYHDLLSKAGKTEPDISFLKRFEKKYGIDLWTLAMNDRIFNHFNEFYNFSTNEILSIMETECKEFEKIIDTVRPKCVLLWHPTLRQDYLFYLICKAKGIRTLILRGTRIAKKFIISEEHNNTGFQKFDQQNNMNYDAFELLEYHEKFDQQKITKGLDQYQSSKKDMLKSCFKYFFSKNENPNTHYTYFGRTKFKVLIKYIKFSIQTKVRKRFIDKNLIRSIGDNQFIFFPLHMEQERSTLLDAPFHNDQLSIIKQIVKSLPVGFQLYVKEHPSMRTRQWRKISFYNELMSYPNVKVIHPSVNTDMILKKCSLVITITGTAGFDAGFYKKPAITFVETDYSSLGHVTMLESVSELPESIKKSLNNDVSGKDLIEYIQYIEKNSFEIDIRELHQNIQNIINYGGYLTDVEIDELKFDSLLKLNKNKFDKLAEEYLKKIRAI